MSTYLTVVALIFALMLAGIGVDRLYRAFAARHPRLGPYRKNDGGCGCCAAKSACDTMNANATPAPTAIRIHPR